MRKPLRRAILGFVIASGPLATACQAVLDFDRTPLQINYEAGPPPEDTGTGGTSSSGGTTDAPSDAPPRETGADASDASDGAPTPGDADAADG